MNLLLLAMMLTRIDSIARTNIEQGRAFMGDQWGPDLERAEVQMAWQQVLPPPDPEDQYVGSMDRP